MGRSWKGWAGRGVLVRDSDLIFSLGGVAESGKIWAGRGVLVRDFDLIFSLVGVAESTGGLGVIG